MILLFSRQSKSRDKSINYRSAERMAKEIVVILLGHPESTVIVDSMSRLSSRKEDFKRFTSNQIRINKLAGKVDVENFLNFIEAEFKSYHKSRSEWYKQFAEAVEQAFLILMRNKYAVMPNGRIFGESIISIVECPMRTISSPKPFDVIAWFDGRGEFMEVKSNIDTHLKNTGFKDKLVFMNSVSSRMRPSKRSRILFSVGTLSQNPTANVKIRSILKARGYQECYVKVITSSDITSWMSSLVV